MDTAPTESKAMEFADILDDLEVDIIGVAGLEGSLAGTEPEK